MKSKLIKIICLIFLFSSCNNRQDKSKIPLKKEKKTYQSIFLGLSPNMSENEFSTKIKELNKNGKLEDGKFPLLVDGQEFLFEINKRQNSIKLSYSEEYSVQEKHYLLYEKFDKEFSKKGIWFDKCKNNFFKILNKKYKLNKLQIPSKIDLEKIGLEYCDDYKIFVDQNKYILFGTKFYGLKDPIISMGFKHNKEEEEKSVIGNMVSTHDYGMKIFIYYIPVEKYQELKKRIIKEIKLKEYREKSYRNKQKEKIQNTNEL